LKLGDQAIYGSPGELFSVFNEEIKRKSPFKRKFVSSLTNDEVGYIIDPACYREGVYEARQTVFPPEGGSEMNRILLRLGESLK